MAEPAFTFTDQIRPVCEIGMSDVREAEPDTWLDVSCHVHEVEIFRGRERFSDHFMPATASITFDNRSGWGDLVGAPLIVAGQTLRPARPIRVGVSGVFDDDTVESTRWLYRGWIDQATPAYDPVLHDVVTVNCIDAFGEAGQSVAPTGPEQGINETVTARVNRVLDAVGWFPAKRKVATVATTVQGTELGSRAVDLMTAAADSAGGVVFGDLDGDVVLKPIDWMLYDPDDPPDGEIGNMDPGDPGLEDVPVYVDPDLGTVYDPDPPPMEHPPIVQLCVTAEDPFGMIQGTFIEQGDSWRIYAIHGHIYYESSGRVWDMGPFDGQGCVTIYPPGDDPDTEPPVLVEECPVEGETTDPNVARTALEEDDPHPDTSPGGAAWVDFDDGLWIHTDGSTYDAEGWRNASGQAINDVGDVIGTMFWDAELEMCVETPTCPGETTDPNVARTALEEDDPHPDTSPGGAAWVDFDAGMWIYEDDSRYDAEGWRNAAGEAMNVWSPTFEACVPECPEGQVYDLGADTCVPDCPEGQWWDADLEACVDEPTCPEGQEWARGYDSPGGACVDVTPVPPPDVPPPGPGPGDPPPEDGDPVDPTTVFTVELLGWDDRGFDELPTTRIDPITVTPGVDCLLVVLVNALSTVSNLALLSPVVSGGGLDWFHHRHADQAGEGAASFIMMAQVGRDDPGTFDVAVDWASPATTRSHIATVWKVRNAVNDYVERFDAGLVLYATVDSNPPDEAQPGDGPQTVTMVADDPPVGFPALPRAVDITIAQSLAEESEGPFGAVFDESNGPWNYPPNAPAQPAVALLVAGFSDDFERAAGGLGSDWIEADTGPSDGLLILDGSGSAVAPVVVDGASHDGHFAFWSTPVTGDYSVSVEIADMHGEEGGANQIVSILVNFDLATFTGLEWSFVISTSSPGDGNLRRNRWEDGVQTATAVQDHIDNPAVLRVDKTGDVYKFMYLPVGGVEEDDYVVSDESDWPEYAAGDHVGFRVLWDTPAAQSPRIDGFEVGDATVRKASWVAAWRQGVTYADVVLDDVNLGVDDIQSAQAALVLESAETDDFPITPYGPITIGGATDPYNGLIDYVALFDPVTGEPILRFP